MNTNAVQADAAQRFEPVIETIQNQGDTLRNLAGVLGVRPGFRIENGRVTDEPAIIVVTQPRAEIGQIPSELNGISVQTQTATPLEQLEGVIPLDAWTGALPEAAPNIHYTPPDPHDVSLQEEKVHNITCHIGPDSGWITLKPFLEGTKHTLTVAMYEFYAPQILTTVTNLGNNTNLSVDMILQVSANDKDTEAQLQTTWHDRLKFVPALVSGPNKIFANSYHIKVAVRDSSAFWLSSGNWSPHSQPEIPPGSDQVLYSKGNREWHVIIEDETLAQTYEKFIKWDMQEASGAPVPEEAELLPDLFIPESAREPEAVVLQDHPFIAKTFATRGVPVRVKPLLSPDNYADEILNLIQNTKKSLYLQFAYIRQPSINKFDQIISAIAAKMQAGLDVRVLVDHMYQQQAHTDLLLGARGWVRNMFRLQTSTVHNKGIISDGKIAVVGSNNWSSDGTQYNRDSSIILYSRPIAQYFTAVFLFDWNNLAQDITQHQESVAELAPAGEPTPPGMVRVPWNEWFED